MEKLIENAEMKYRELWFNYLHKMLEYIKKSTDMEDDVWKEVGRLDTRKYTRKCDSSTRDATSATKTKVCLWWTHIKYGNQRNEKISKRIT